MNLNWKGQWLDSYCNKNSRFVCEADTDNNHVAGYLDENDKFQCNASVLMTSYSSDVSTTVVTDINSDIVAPSSVKAASSPATTLPEPSTSFPMEPTPSSTVTSVPFHTHPTPFNTETAALDTMAIFSTLETSEIQLFGVTDTIDIQPYGPTTVSEDMETKLTYMYDPNPARVTKEVCRCACIPTGRLSDLSPLVLKKKEAEIRRDLILNTKTLTMTIAKVKSAEDERKSAVGIGLLGVFLISCPLMLIILSDLCTIKFRR
ncbi:uncharacterized protein LOC124146955 [Haliotis rufescens]|uniref:uncharacterized protein LOC124146955 n=1 Tax=Haliotis rufescens TaxID=6454 RepID=UPI00201F8EAF|nr:uncharacterized protein LOC124146955 [Haliotis rufescens]